MRINNICDARRHRKELQQSIKNRSPAKPSLTTESPGQSHVNQAASANQNSSNPNTNISSGMQMIGDKTISGQSTNGTVVKNQLGASQNVKRAVFFDKSKTVSSNNYKIPSDIAAVKETQSGPSASERYCIINAFYPHLLHLCKYIIICILCNSKMY